MTQAPETNPWITNFTRCVQDKFNKKWSLNFNYKLEKEIDVQKKEEGWKIYQTSSFGRFNCPCCSNSWSSARTILLFHYRLKKKGLVLLRLFRQQCRECGNPTMLKPQVDSTQINQVFDRLVEKILKNCYHKNNVNENSRPLIPRKTKPHEVSLCEACRLGICSF
ncbi:receptor-transporting protein 3-like [Narcine bancroftii]|uniref:receptor-transporting protein 3-like n=1 Tax=Narcine bancroftii TaxID=1343680 RepID=UPI0038320ED8